VVEYLKSTEFNVFLITQKKTHSSQSKYIWELLWGREGSQNAAAGCAERERLHIYMNYVFILHIKN